MIKVVIVDDHEMVRIGVSAYLSAQPDIEVIGEATNGQEAIDKVLALPVLENAMKNPSAINAQTASNKLCEK